MFGNLKCLFDDGNRYALVLLFQSLWDVMEETSASNNPDDKAKGEIRDHVRIYRLRLPIPPHYTSILHRRPQSIATFV